MGDLCREHLCERILQWVMGCEASYIPISLCFPPPCQPGTLTAYFPTLPLSLMPPLVTMLEPCISPHRPLHLAPSEHSATAISKAIGIL